MATPRTIVLSAVLALGLPSTRTMAADGWGASWSFGPSTSRIIYAKTTIVPGRFPPMSSVGPLFLWPGMSNSKGDLIQTTLEAWSDNTWCGAKAGVQWCVRASVFGSFGQRDGAAAAIDPDDHVTIEYKLEADGNTWTQTVKSKKLGKVVSTLQSASGPMPGTGFGFATEADADSYTIDTQYYLCTELHFAEADPHFGSTGVGANGAKYGANGTGSGPGTVKNLRTLDGGLTWLVDLVTLPAMNPQGTQTPPPAIDCGTSGAGGTGGEGGTSGSGGGGANGGTGGSAPGGARGTGGTGSGGRTGGTGGKGGTGGSASGGTGGTGRSDAGMGGSASGGASGIGRGGTGGAVAGSGGAAGASSGDTGTSASAGGGTGGMASGSGGAGTGGVVQGGAGSGGATGTSMVASNGSPGCSCSVQQGVPGSAGGAFLLLGFLVASRVSRRRRVRRSDRVSPL